MPNTWPFSSQQRSSQLTVTIGNKQERNEGGDTDRYARLTMDDDLSCA